MRTEDFRKPTQGPAFMTLLLAMFLYAVSLIKFFVRDPLSLRTGLQGPIEIGLVILAALVLAVVFRQRYWNFLWTPSAVAFMAFGAMATLSSVYSYYPLLSFLKGLSFLLVCGIAVVASSAFGPKNVITSLYRSLMIILAIGLIAKVAGGGPLLSIDDYSGRARFTLFAWHPGTLADLCALTLLTGLLLPKRPPLYCQIFLFAINVATASRASSALLVIILVSIRLATVRLSPRFLFLCCCFGSVLTLAMLVMIQKQGQPAEMITIGQSLHGDKLAEDLITFSGRKEVWSAAEPLVSHSLFLGYGLDGSRDVLINNTTWGAGNAHNSLLDLILAAGFPAMLVFFAGWATAVKSAWQWRMFTRIGVLEAYTYIAAFGIFSPNLTYLQGLSSFLILTMDAMVFAEISQCEARGRRYFPMIEHYMPRQVAESWKRMPRRSL